MKLSIQTPVLLLTALIGTTCMAGDFQQGMVEIGKGAGNPNTLPELCSKPDDEFAPDGHYFTTNKVAELAGIGPEVNREITLFSQAPDDLALSYSATAVAIWGVVWIPYRQRIVETLHSLHGGHQGAVEARRTRLAAMIKNFDLRPENRREFWKVGFLIHALADSYAHVHGEGKTLKAYNVVWGHAWDSLFGDNPDDISGNVHAFANYVAYAQALFEALDRSSPPSAENRARFNEWLATVKAGKVSPFPAADLKFGTLPCDAREEAKRLLSIPLVNAYLFEVTQKLQHPIELPSRATPAVQRDGLGDDDA